MTRANGQPVPDEVSCLLPVIARVFDLGRGPPGLVGWVRQQLAAAGTPPERLDGAQRRLLLLRLARDLARRLRPAELTATVAVKVSETIRVGRPEVE